MSNRLYKVLAVLFIILIMVIFGIWFFYEPQIKELAVTFFDVGQGDSIFIKTPVGQNILIDGGPDNTIIERLGQVLTWPDNQIDLIILTHPHDDHVGGLVSVLKRYRVKRILYTGVLHSSPSYLEWLQLVKNQKIPLTIIDRSQTINFGSDIKFEILNPTESLLAKEVKNLNNSAIAGILTYKKIKFFLGGDIEAEIENQLIANKTLQKVNIFKANHHGSDTGNTEQFLNFIKPDLTVIQVGKNNKFKHPSLRTLKKLERIASDVYRNDQEGNITINSDGEKYWLK